MQRKTNEPYTTQSAIQFPLRLRFLLALLALSLVIAFWLQPVRAASPTDSPLALPRQSSGPFEQMGGPNGSTSPLAWQPDRLPFTPLSALLVQMTDFVASLDVFQAAQNLSAAFASDRQLLPFLGLRVGNQPPVITQPNPQSGFPATVPANHFFVFLPILFGGPRAAATPVEPPTPPFSCKNLQDFPDNRDFPKQTQCQALRAFYTATQGDDWKNNDGWLRDNDPCRWKGVICQAGIGVVEIRLSNNGLFGHLPSEIGHLPLRILDVSQNTLTGHLPEELLELNNLQEIHLHGNRFRGSYPIQFFHLPNASRGLPGIQELHTNRFDRIDTSSYQCGPVALQRTSTAGCEALVAFFRTTNGENPNSIYWTVYGGNWLTDPNPCNWLGVYCNDGRVKGLRFSDSLSRQLTGSLPAQLGNLTEATDLSIEGAQLSGPLPPEISRLTNLQVLSIRNSGLSSTLPPELGLLSRLEQLDLAGNQLTGPIPASLGNLRAIQRIDLSRNNLSGEVPSELMLVNTGTSIRFHTLALDGNPDLCLPAELGRFVSGLDYYRGKGCNPLGR